jgi:hypothetical protein
MSLADPILNISKIRKPRRIGLPRLLLVLNSL